MKKIFITGASGFIGQALITNLKKEGWLICGLIRHKAKVKNLKGLKWVYGDIRDGSWHKYVKGSTVMVHLAGIHGFIRIPYSKRLAIELEGTKNAIRAAKVYKVKHFLHVGTAYTHMVTDYARAKNITKRYVVDEIKKGFPATIICPVAVYGPGNDINFSRIYKGVKENRFVFVGDGKNNLCIIYIDDLVTALIKIIQNPKVFLGKTVLITGENIALKSLVEIISKKYGRKSPGIHLPVVPMKVLGKIFSNLSNWGLPTPFTYDTILTLISNQNYRTSRELKKIGFRPKIHFKEGIKRTLQ